MKYPPYQYASVVEDIEIGVGEKLYCVEFEKQGNPGAWMGKKLLTTEEEARQYFAIIPEFKEQGIQLVLREYKVTQAFKARFGIAGPQFSPSINKNFVGGGEQFQLLDGVNWNTNLEKYFEPLDEIEKGIRKYVQKLN